MLGLIHVPCRERVLPPNQNTEGLFLGSIRLLLIRVHLFSTIALVLCPLPVLPGNSLVGILNVGGVVFRFDFLRHGITSLHSNYSA